MALSFLWRSSPQPSPLVMNSQSRHKTFKNPFYTQSHGPVDQLEDRCLRKAEAAGSNPARSTRFTRVPCLVAKYFLRLPPGPLPLRSKMSRATNLFFKKSLAVLLSSNIPPGPLAHFIRSWTQAYSENSCGIFLVPPGPLFEIYTYHSKTRIKGLEKRGGGWLIVIMNKGFEPCALPQILRECPSLSL